MLNPWQTSDLANNNVGGYTYKVTQDSAGAVVYIHRPLIGTPSSGATVTMTQDGYGNVIRGVGAGDSTTPAKKP